jgi:L-fuconolactonase
MTTNRFDSHQHFWRLSRRDYSWMSPQLKPIYRDFMPADLQPLLASHGVHRTVIVQAAATVAETEFMLQLADENVWIAGVVGWVDMESPQAIGTLERLREHPKFRGIRPMIQDIANPDWMLRPGLTAVFNWLERHSVSFDALVKPVHLKNLGTLLRRHSGLRTVIDHGGKPEIRNNDFDGWAREMETLASSSNALCKLSGLLTEAAPGAGYKELAPYIDHLLKCFTPARLMWGSDWPVLNLSSSYAGWVSICEQALATLPAADRAAIWHDNAAAFYLPHMDNLIDDCRGSVTALNFSDD